MIFILGKKIEMSQIFRDNQVLPVTLIEAGPCFVVELKTRDKHGYFAVKLGFEKKKNGEFRYLKEFPVSQQDLSSFKKDQKIDVSGFKVGDKVKVSGISKGKGFQGVVKRWGFSGFGASHGVKHGERAPGSIGSAFPQRVFKGKKMAGHMGAKRVTVKGLEVVAVDSKNNLMALKGAVPGSRGTFLEIKTLD